MRHPEGKIFLRTQTQGFLTSLDRGETWARLPVDFTRPPDKQTLHGLGVSRDGRLWLMHQSPGGKDLFVSVSEDTARAWSTSSIDYANLAPRRAGRASSVKESWFARGGVDGIILLVSAAYDEDPHMRRSDRLSTPSRT